MNCVVNHAHCTHTQTRFGQKPSRLVAVGFRDDFSDVRLCLSNEIKSDFLYATLSHCWGRDGSKTKLTASSEQQFMKQILWEPLPRTFKDAIKVTRKLQVAFGIQYIWIDALCIVQDFTEDWRREASRMGDIYYFSFCNLAACVGSDCDSGLFHDRDPFSSHTCIVRAQIDDSAKAFFEVENRESLDVDIEPSYLGSRAWVPQEILLAPRILYFASQKIVWECASLCACEKAPARDSIGSPIKRHCFDSPALLTAITNERTHPDGADYRLYRI